ncbi:uncharacterized protein LOC126560488 [Anopheles maculipalpis]|uniref:uncharacterized protein LOC126560488 n=1 Tax=Anopheles maculipalpis TaxID=1496333 RepID=UPI002158E290|nr:uncharacterized protein LOC126560488 [Anopheles maculipalpis]
MHYTFSSIQTSNHVLLVICVIYCFVSSCDETKVVQIFGSRIIPEHSELSLECEVVSDVLQNTSINWFFSENMTPINTNKHNSSTSRKSTLHIKNVLRQQTNIYYCCLNDSTTICATHSVIVLYTTFERQIMPINETSGILILTESANHVPKQFSNIDFAVCLRYRWKIENVDIVFASGAENHHNDSVVRSSDRTPFLKHLYYIVKFTLRTGNRLFEVRYSNNVSEATYYLHVFLNGKPKPKMNDIVMLPDTGSIDLSCWGMAIPAPKVMFSFTPCPSLDWTNCNNSPVTLDEITSTGMITFNVSVKVIGSSLSSGIVHCKATNSEGSSWTHAKLFQLHQQEAVMFFHLHQTATIYVGDSLTVHCSVDRYNFTNRFTFHFNDQLREVLGVQDNFNWVANLTLNNVTASDNEAICAALHQNGTLIRKTLALHIVQPYIDACQRVRHLLAKPDTQMLLSCDAIGRSMPRYRWFKNDIELPYTNFMMVASLSRDDKFKCIAWNRAGVISITWIMSNPSIWSLHIFQCLMAILLLAVMGTVFCYFRVKQL